MAFTPVTLIGTYVTPTGVSCSGSVTFTLTSAMADTSSNVIAARDTVTASIVSGSFSVALYANNDSTTIPTGTTYKVVEALNGSPSNRTYEITLTSSPTTQYLADLVPATTTPAYNYLLNPGSPTDNYVITADSSSALGYKWSAVPGGSGSGDVVGPSSATNGDVVLFDGTTGKLVKDGGALGTAAFVNTGTGNSNAILGNDSRLTDSRTPTGSAGGDLTGTYPNPTLATTGVSAATYGSGAAVSSIAIDAKGRITAASNVPITIVSTQVTGTAVLTGDSRLTDSRAPSGSAGGDLTGTYPNPTLTLTGVTAGTYGSGAAVSSITLTSTGRVTAASNVPITITSGQVSGLGTLAGLSTVTTNEITDGTITNADVSTTAAVATTKLANPANAEILVGAWRFFR